jgi:oligosaccharide repeat unit polymerase
MSCDGIQMSVESSFLGLALAMVGGALYGIHRYRTPLNPLTVFSVLQVGLFTLTSGVVAYSYLSSTGYPPEALTKTAMIAVVYFAGNIATYLVLGEAPVRLFDWLMRSLRLGSERISVRFSLFKFLFLLGCAAGAFAGVAVVGGGGMRWITDTRTAYIANRAGAGPLYAAMEWCLVFALLHYLWARRPRGIRLIFITWSFAFAAYFSGSKGSVVIMFVIGIVYYQFFVRRISIGGYLVLSGMILSVFSVLLGIQGMRGGLFETSRTYFRDYFDVTTQFLWRFDEFGYHYGSASLSDLWFYVPRLVFPNKPYEYGALLIHRVLFPGAAETGNTPGILGWAMAYLDFGVAGVFVSGVLAGFWQRGAFEYFLKNRQSVIAFLLMMQFALFAPLQFATAGMTFILAILFCGFFRPVLRPARYLFTGATGVGQFDVMSKAG